MPEDQYESLVDLMTVLNATSRGFKGQSVTAQRQLMNERSKGSTGIMDTISQWRSTRTLDKVSGNIANLLTNDYNQEELALAADQIRKFASINKGGESDKMFEAVRAAMAVVTGEALASESFKED